MTATTNNVKPGPLPLDYVFTRLERIQDRHLEDYNAAGTSQATSNGHGHGHSHNHSHTPFIHPLMSLHPHSSMLPPLIAVALLPHNLPKDYISLFDYFSSRYRDDQVDELATLVLRLRTALFKAVPLCGVPRIINALSSLHTAVLRHPSAQEIVNRLPKTSTKPTKSTLEDRQAGWEFFQAIYTKHAQPILQRIGDTNPDLSEMIVDELYGANLARTEVLSWQETVLIEFVGCASLDCPAQAKGHFFGCRNLGVSKFDVKLGLDVLREISAWSGIPFNEERFEFVEKLDSW